RAAAALRQRDSEVGAGDRAVGEARRTAGLDEDAASRDVGQLAAAERAAAVLPDEDAPLRLPVDLAALEHRIGAVDDRDAGLPALEVAVLESRLGVGAGAVDGRVGRRDRAAPEDGGPRQHAEPGGCVAREGAAVEEDGGTGGLERDGGDLRARDCAAVQRERAAVDGREARRAGEAACLERYLDAPFERERDAGGGGERAIGEAGARFLQKRLAHQVAGLDDERRAGGDERLAAADRQPVQAHALGRDAKRRRARGTFQDYAAPVAASADRNGDVDLNSFAVDARQHLDERAGCGHRERGGDRRVVAVAVRRDNEPFGEIGRGRRP